MNRLKLRPTVQGYLILIASVVFLQVLSLILIQTSLYRVKGDFSMENILGRQRMLSQKLLKTIYVPSYDKPAFTPNNLDLNLWKTNHLLLVGSTNLQEGNITDEMGHQISIVDQYFDNLYGHFEQVAAGNSSLDHKTVSELDNLYLENMDLLVNMYQGYSEDKLNRVIVLIMVLFIITLLVITYEVMYYVLPIIRKTHSQQEALKSIAWQQSHQVRTHVANIISLGDLIDLDDSNEDEIKSLVKVLVEETEKLDALTKSIVNKADEFS